MLSGVSPCGTCHAISPRSRSILDKMPYGGFTMGKPCTFNPSTGGGAPAAVGGGGGGVGRGGASAAQQSPGPSTSRNGWPPIPDTYLMSENPAGGSTSDRADAPMLPACA